MTNSKLILFFLLMTFFACDNEADFLGTETDVNPILKLVNYPGNNPMPPSIIYSDSELIVQYDESLTDINKNDIRNEFQVLTYEVCAHCDGTIEKWDFGPDADIEHKYASAKEKEADAEGLFMVDREFAFKAEDPEYVLTGGSGAFDYSARVVTANAGVTIAVLDSGVDANYVTFDHPFLYRYEEMGSDIQSGWDYVEENDNCYDDNINVHGTAVASIIHNYLYENSIAHQILPIKVADEDGKVNLFNALCGIKFAAEKAEIIQMSFGWYDDGEEEDAFTNDIFSSLIEKYKNEVLFVTSAGNSGLDNDIYNHYPSNYGGTNIIAVAAANETMDGMAEFSNYGASTVHFISQGEHLNFLNMEEAPVFISGTSFSAPQVAAIAARELALSDMTLDPEGIVANLNLLGIPAGDLFAPTIFNKILLP